MTRTTHISRRRNLPGATPWHELSANSSTIKQTSQASGQGKDGDKSAEKSSKVKGKLSKGIYKSGKRIKTEEQRKLKNVKRTDKRRAMRQENRKNAQICFGCRQDGHKLSDCPNKNVSEGGGTGICFKCGSTEHMSKECKYKSSKKFTFATCFICTKSGHLAKDCPKNDNGLYPNGGCCVVCESTRHLSRNCPQKSKEQGIGNVTLRTIGKNENADADVDEVEVEEPSIKLSDMTFDQTINSSKPDKTTGIRRNLALKLNRKRKNLTDNFNNESSGHQTGSGMTNARHRIPVKKQAAKVVKM